MTARRMLSAMTLAFAFATPWPAAAAPHWLEGLWYGNLAPQAVYSWEEIYVAQIDAEGFVHGLICVDGFLMLMAPHSPYKMRANEDGMTMHVGGMTYHYTRQGSLDAPVLAGWRRRDDWTAGREEQWKLDRPKKAVCATHALWAKVAAMESPVPVPPDARDRAERLCSWSKARYPHLNRRTSEIRLTFVYRAPPAQHLEDGSKSAYYECGSGTWQRASSSPEPGIRECTTDWRPLCETSGFAISCTPSGPSPRTRAFTGIIILTPWHAVEVVSEDQAQLDTRIQDTLLHAYVALCGLRLHIERPDLHELLDLIASRVSYSRLQTWFDGRWGEKVIRAVFGINETHIDDMGMLESTPTAGDRRRVRDYVLSAFGSYVSGAVRATEKFEIPLRNSFEDRLASFALLLNDVVAGREEPQALKGRLASLADPPGISQPQVPEEIDQLATQICAWARTRYPRLHELADGSRLQLLHRGVEPALYDCGFELWGPLNGVWLDGSWKTVESFWSCVEGNKPCPSRVRGFAYPSAKASSKRPVCNGIVLLNEAGQSDGKPYPRESLLETTIHEYVIHCGLSDHLTVRERNAFLDLIASHAPYTRLKTWFGQGRTASSCHRPDSRQ